MATDEQAILDMLAAAAKGRIGRQLADSDAFDAKALGVLALDAAAIALLVATHDTINRHWWIAVVGLGAAGGLLVAAIWPRKFDTGPDLRDFYESWGGASNLIASRQMLGELLATIDHNKTLLPGKGQLFRVGLVILVLSLIGSVPVALMHPS